MNEKQKLVKELRKKLHSLISIVRVDPISGKAKNSAELGRLAQFEINEIVDKIKRIAKSQEMS